MPRPRLDEPETDRTKQVVNHIRALLEKGVLQPGDRIPPDGCLHAHSRLAEQAFAQALATL
jgi:DNA-binding FadR family transcriptional regulator